MTGRISGKCGINVCDRYEHPPCFYVMCFSENLMSTSHS